MAEPRHLPNAPVIEALIDLRVAAAEGSSVHSLAQTLETGDFGYCLKSPISQNTFEFRVPGDGQPPDTNSQSAVVGFRLHSHDERYVAQWQLGGLTISRLQPYEDWPTLMSEFQRVWRIYVERCAPQQVIRVAARYINDLRLPLAHGESYQRFLNTLVEIPNGAPQAVEAFTQRFQLVDAPSENRVLLSLSNNGQSAGGTAQVVLDIDAFRECDLAPDAAEIWAALDRLRELKNRCFFATLRDEALELYA